MEVVIDVAEMKLKLGETFYVPDVGIVEVVMCARKVLSADYYTECRDGCCLFNPNKDVCLDRTIPQLASEECPLDGTPFTFKLAEEEER